MIPLADVRRIFLFLLGNMSQKIPGRSVRVRLEKAPENQKGHQPENSSKSNRRGAETRRPSRENSQPSGLLDGWFSAFEHSRSHSCAHPFGESEKRRTSSLVPVSVSLCVSASPRLFELPVLARINCSQLMAMRRRQGMSPGARQSPEPSLTVGLLNRSEAQVSSPRVSKGSASTQRLMGL